MVKVVSKIAAVLGLFIGAAIVLAVLDIDHPMGLLMVGLPIMAMCVWVYRLMFGDLSS